jgi:hypothetical protein
MWLVPSLHDMLCIVVFLIVNAISFLASYVFIMDPPNDAKGAKMQSSILIYGSSQSFIGYVGGFYISKILYGTMPQQRDYVFVKSDEDIMDGVV